MEGQRFRVYNETRSTLLRMEVTAVDTTVEPFKKLIQDLEVKSDAGLWLNPYRGIPAVPGLPAFDLIHLDEHNRVLQDVEGYPNPILKPLEKPSESALVLPPRTNFALTTRAGDQLLICDPKSMEERLDLLAVATDSGVDKRNADFRGTAAKDDGRSPAHLDEVRSELTQHGTGRREDRINEPRDLKKETRLTKILRALHLKDAEPDRAVRHPVPGLACYHWTGGAPQAYQVANISKTGFFLLIKERPFPGTIILVTLQRTDSNGKDAGDSIAVHAKVIRWAANGVGLEFVLSNLTELNVGGAPEGRVANRETLNAFLRRLDLPDD